MGGRKRVAANILRNGAKAIEQYGWVQGRFGTKYSGFCALGGINHSIPVTDGSSDDARLATRALRTVIGMNVAKWNDTGGRSKTEVVSAMRKAAAALEHGLVVPAYF